VTDPQHPAEPEAPKPTLDDVARLTPESDFRPFTAPGVDAQVRNEALKKLFLGDPHFRQGDGLDVRVDEVVELARSPLARQRKILQARALGLLDDDLVDQAEPPAPPEDKGPAG
jgi:hypothetical protein